MTGAHGVAPTGLPALRQRLARIEAVTGAARPSFESLLASAVITGRGPRIWDVGAPAGTATATAGLPTTAGAATAGLPTTPGAGVGVVPTPTPGPSAPGGSPWTGSLPDAGRPWAEPIATTATRHGLDPGLLAALVWSESGFRPDAVSPAGATGLTQLMPATAASLGVDPTDPLQNLDGGARFLRSMLDRFGDVDLALAAYNAGPGRVDRHGGIPPIAETQRFVQVVRERWSLLGGPPSSPPSAGATP